MIDREPPFENVHLGDTRDRAYGRRLVSLCKGLVILWRERATLRRADALYALNTDNALLAVAARTIASKDLPLFFEIDDIQRLFIGSGVRSRIVRWIERWVLTRTTCLVTTSPAFVREYFKPMQGYRGDIFLLENKVYPSSGLVEQRPARAAFVCFLGRRSRGAAMSKVSAQPRRCRVNSLVSVGRVYSAQL